MTRSESGSSTERSDQFLAAMTMPSLQPSANMTASPVRNAPVSSSRSEENDMSSPNSIYSETAFMRLSPEGAGDAPLKHTSGAIMFWFMIRSFERPSLLFCLL